MLIGGLITLKVEVWILEIHSVKYNTSCTEAMDQNLNWNLLHQFAKELGQEGHDYKIHKRSLSDTVSTHKEIVIEYGYKQEEQ